MTKDQKRFEKWLMKRKLCFIGPNEIQKSDLLAFDGHLHFVVLRGDTDKQLITFDGSKASLASMREAARVFGAGYVTYLVKFFVGTVKWEEIT